MTPSVQSHNLRLKSMKPSGIKLANILMLVSIILFSDQAQLLAQGQTVEVPFESRWDDFEPDILDIRDIVHDPPAGWHGHVIVRNGRLYFEDGTPARFWGVGLTFGGDSKKGFPSDYETSKKIVDRLARLGFNHVRFVGLDSSGRQAMNAWLESGSLDSPFMDRLGFFISELKKVGIYYSFSTINSAIGLLEGIPGLPPNRKARKKLWRYKYIKLYHPLAVERIMEWYKAFYAWINPHTGLTLAEDPANIYVAAVNEDSIFQAFFNNFKHLDEYYKNILENVFNRFLEGKYGSIRRTKRHWSMDRSDGPCLLEDQDSGLAGIRLLMPAQLKDTCRQRRRDTIEFLVEVESSLYRKIKETLRDVGYKGLFTGTNNWYGYGNLLANASVSDYIEMHGYFDHPKRINRPTKTEAYYGHSYTARNHPSQIPIEREHSYPLSKTFRASLHEKPFIISEWGHTAWSPYSYEGLAMLSSYAAFQGYDCIDAHTYFNHPNPDPYDNLTRKALSISNNPVLLALFPSFSVAFMRGDISSTHDPVILNCSNSKEEYYDFILENKLMRRNGSCGVVNAMGYSKKIRNLMVGIGAEEDRFVFEENPGEYVTDTDEIIWRFTENGIGHFIVDSPRFKVATSSAESQKVSAKSFEVLFQGHGIVTILSLTHQPIAESNKILITTIQSFQNTQMKTGKSRNLSYILDLGQAPAILTIPKITLQIETSHPSHEDLKVYSINTEGGLDNLGSPTLISDDDEKIYIEFSNGDARCPWYLLTSDPQ